MLCQPELGLRQACLPGTGRDVVDDLLGLLYPTANLARGGVQKMSDREKTLLKVLGAIVVIFLVYLLVF